MPRPVWAPDPRKGTPHESPTIRKANYPRPWTGSCYVHARLCLNASDPRGKRLFWDLSRSWARISPRIFSDPRADPIWSWIPSQRDWPGAYDPPQFAGQFQLGTHGLLAEEFAQRPFEALSAGTGALA